MSREGRTKGQRSAPAEEISLLFTPWICKAFTYMRRDKKPGNKVSVRWDLLSLPFTCMELCWWVTLTCGLLVFSLVTKKLGLSSFGDYCTEFWNETNSLWLNLTDKKLLKIVMMSSSQQWEDKLYVEWQSMVLHISCSNDSRVHCDKCY